MEVVSFAETDSNGIDSEMPWNIAANEKLLSRVDPGFRPNLVCAFQARKGYCIWNGYRKSVVPSSLTLEAGVAR